MIRSVLEVAAFVLALVVGLAVVGWAGQWLAGRGWDEPRESILPTKRPPEK